MRDQNDERSRFVARYQTFCEPLGEYVGILAGVIGILNRDIEAIGTGVLIYCGAKGTSNFMQNHIDFYRYKALEDKIKSNTQNHKE